MRGKSHNVYIVFLQEFIILQTQRCAHLLKFTKLFQSAYTLHAIIF